MQIDPSKSYDAIFTTEIGDFTVRLFPEQAPVTVNNFVFLARQGYYDDTTFHRVLPGFMAQGGDPTGTGGGGPGYSFEDEFHPELQFDKPGLLAMANRGPNTNGGQFFITYAPTTHLTGLHTIFGEVVEGAEVVSRLRPRDPQANPDFQGDGLISIDIIESGG
jgi:cyclophilin family peptidyl-prolyl cis-trans isomerase